MISFCQDLSISYQYQVFENKTIKKIPHSRNPSNLSDNRSAKSNKLTLVSKNPPLNKSLHNTKGISLTDTKKPSSPANKARPQHKRHFSNQFEMTVIHPSDQNQPQNQLPSKDISFAQPVQVQSIELHQRPYQQRVNFNRPQQLQLINPQKSPTFISQSPTMPSHSFVQSAKHISEQQSPFKIWELHESQTIRINSSLERLDESRETRRVNYEKNESIMQNNSHANSLRSYETLRIFGKRNAKESETEEDLKSQKNLFDFNKDMIFLTPKISHAKKFANTSHFNNLEQNQSQGLEHKIILPQILFSTDNFYSDEKSPLFDAASIVSKNLDDEDVDDQSLSIVQQRNFFFEKEEEPNNAFKKSIEKFIFFQPGYESEHQKWVLFRNVQEKENKKIYSIKEFGQEDEKEYFNEYDMYLSLKTETSQQQLAGRESQCVFLQLFNALSNNEERKLHLVKEPFEYLLRDYIGHLKKKNTLAMDRVRILVSEKSKLETEIEKVFEFFSSKDVLIREGESLEMEDFVVCLDNNGRAVVKFHSLSKLEKRENNSMVMNRQSQGYKIKRNRGKLDDLYEKIHGAFFFE